MKLKHKGDAVAVLKESTTDAIVNIALTVGCVVLVVIAREDTGIVQIVKNGGLMFLWVAFLLTVALYRLLASPIRKLFKPSIRFNKNTGWITRGSEQLANIQDVAAVQLRMIIDSDKGNERSSLVMNNNSKVFLVQEWSVRDNEAAAVAVAAFLDVELRRKGFVEDPWKEPTVSGRGDG